MSTEYSIEYDIIFSIGDRLPSINNLLLELIKKSIILLLLFLLLLPKLLLIRVSRLLLNHPFLTDLLLYRYFIIYSMQFKLFNVSILFLYIKFVLCLLLILGVRELLYALLWCLFCRHLPGRLLLIFSPILFSSGSREVTHIRHPSRFRPILQARSAQGTLIHLLQSSSISSPSWILNVWIYWSHFWGAQKFLEQYRHFPKVIDSIWSKALAFFLQLTQIVYSTWDHQGLGSQRQFDILWAYFPAWFAYLLQKSAPERLRY